MKFFFGIIVLGLLSCGTSLANNLKVIDGDTIFLNGDKIRFFGIDTPELNQTCLLNFKIIDCGKNAKILLLKKIGKNIPKCINEGKDVYKRTLA